MRKAPDSLHTLIASGDVYLRNSEPLQEIPEADVVCYGLWVDPALATGFSCRTVNLLTNLISCFKSLLSMSWDGWRVRIFF